MHARSKMLIEELRGLQSRLHRLEPSRPLRDVRAAAAFIRERKIVLAAGRSSLPMLAEAIVGRPIRGSWMADPEVFRIHRLMRRVHRAGGVISAALIQGKETLIDVSLGPAVQRIAGDPARRAAAVRDLPPPARALLDAVESSGEVRMDRWRASPRAGRDARLQLMERWLVVSSQLHTEAGYHTALVRPWRTSPLATRFGKATRRLDYDDALRMLCEAGLRSAVVVPEREARRWFPFEPAALDGLISSGAIRRLTAARRAWLTCDQ